MDSRSIFLPTLKQLRYLVALQDQGHFGHAAEQLSVSQSTLSAGLAELETLLGVTLVERTKRHVRFTPLGERIARQARIVLREAQLIVETTKASRAPLVGEIRLGVIPTIAPYLLPRALPALRATYPELKLILREGFSKDVCGALDRGELDCVLLALPFNCGEVTEQVLFDDEFLLAMPEKEAGNYHDPVRVNELDPSRLLLLEEGHCLRDHALAACAMPGLNRDQSILGTSLLTLVQMVANGLGVTLLPKMAVQGGIAAGTGLALKPIEGSGAKRTIGLIWRKSDPRTRDFEALAAVLSRQG